MSPIDLIAWWIVFLAALGVVGFIGVVAWFVAREVWRAFRD